MINDNARLSVRWAYNHDDQQFAYGTSTASWNWPLAITDRKNGSRQRAEHFAHQELRTHVVTNSSSELAGVA